MLSSDTSMEDLLPPEPQQPVVVDLESSLEELHDLNITVEEHIREAYVLLHRLQLPPLQPLTPPPELPPQPLTPPPEQENWVGLEAAVAHFDGPEQQLALPPPLVLQQPDAAHIPQFIPVNFAPPPHLPQVDWAMIAYALFTIAERESRQHNDLN